jgi:hypothetical protein
LSYANPVLNETAWFSLRVQFCFGTEVN